MRQPVLDEAGALKAFWGRSLKPLDRLLAERLQSEPASMWWLVAVAAFGLAARFATLGQDSLWADELYSWATTQMSWRHLLLVPYDVHPPLYYALLKAVSALGESEIVLRGLSAGLGLVSVALVYGLSRKYCGPRAALVGAAVTLLSYRLIVHSSTLRNYALMLAACLAASWVLMEILDRAETRRRLGGLSALYVILALLALMSHTVAAIYLAVLCGVAFAAFGAAEPKRIPRIAGLLALLNAPAYLALGAWYLGARDAGSDFGWLQALGLRDALGVFVSNIAPANLPAPVVLASALCVAAGVGVAVLKAPRAYWVPVVTMTVALPATLFLISAVKPVYMERTILMAAPGAALALAALVAGLRNRRLASGLGVLLVVAYGASAVVYLQRDETQASHGMQPIQDLRAAVRLIDRQMTSQAVVLSCDTFTEPALRYYGGRRAYPRLVYKAPATFSLPGGDWEDYFGQPISLRKLPQAEPAALAPYSRVVFLNVDMFCNGQDPAGALATQGYAPGPAHRVQGVTVQIFDRPLARAAP